MLRLNLAVPVVEHSGLHSGKEPALRQRCFLNPRPAGLLLWLFLVGLVAWSPWQSLRPQSLSNDRGRARDMLKVLKDDIQKHYYDPTFHGMDLNAHFEAGDKQLQEANSLGHTFAIVAQVLTDFDDSHTFFDPPRRNYRVDYGWQMQMVGDRCYVVAVKPGSDAESKGLKAGDEVQSIDGFHPARGDLWKLKYLYYTLSPRQGMRLMVRGPDGSPHAPEVMAKVQQKKRVVDITTLTEDFWELLRESESEDRLVRSRHYEMGEPLMIWKMPEFNLENSEIDGMMDRARKHSALILDLRGNPGGYVETLERLVGHFFDHEVKIGDLKGRKEMKPSVAKKRGDRPFEGKLVVLVDAESASASELFARVVQLEKRGTVIGDRTAGAVMTSRYYSHHAGSETVIYYGASITEADVIMADGGSLEKVGVTPDEILLPTAADLAEGRDLVLSRAAALVGAEISPEKAHSLFPIEWRK